MMRNGSEEGNMDTPLQTSTKVLSAARRPKRGGNHCAGSVLRMKLVVPIVMMALFSALFTGVYIWMRRSTFGESERRREKNGQETPRQDVPVLSDVRSATQPRR